MSLSSSERAQYSAIIDDILHSGDLTTISAKQIRKGLQEQLQIDITDKKQDVQSLIMERFDYASSSTAAVPPPPTSAPESHTNGHSTPVETKPKSKSETPTSYSATPEPDEDEEDSDVVSPPKKKRKPAKPIDNDAKFAAMLQAQENSRARATRGGNDKRRIAKKSGTRVKKEKRKSAAKIKKDDDSDLELGSDGEMREKVKKGGFHKQYHLSAQLAELVGEPTLSRPQVVKKIWQHIKANDLQNPSDKRQIRCDDKMQLVFKQDAVHMFTMNKLLGKHLYEVEG